MPASPPHPVSVRIGPSGYRAEVTARGHSFVVDEPAEVGGTDTGPTPYELLTAALGACTVITMRMYADRKGWPLEGVTVHLRHDRIHGRDCADCEHKDAFVDIIEREIEMRGPLDAEQRARLLEIADKCPVHRTLHSEVKVRTREVTASEATAPGG